MSIRGPGRSCALRNPCLIVTFGDNYRFSDISNELLDFKHLIIISCKPYLFDPYWKTHWIASFGFQFDNYTRLWRDVKHEEFVEQINVSFSKAKQEK